MNKLCEKCNNSCKQPNSTIVLECKKYTLKPMQLEFKFKDADKKRTLDRAYKYRLITIPILPFLVSPLTFSILILPSPRVDTTSPSLIL